MTTKNGKHPLVGCGVHWWENGRPSWQGAIKAVISSGTAVGDLAIIQWFEWAWGNPTTSTLVSLSTLTTADPTNHKNAWTIYSNVEDMKDYWDTYGKHKTHIVEKPIPSAFGGLSADVSTFS